MQTIYDAGAWVVIDTPVVTPALEIDRSPKNVDDFNDWLLSDLSERDWHNQSPEERYGKEAV